MIAPRQTGPQVWTGRDLAARPDEWTWHLSDQQIDELITAAKPLASEDGDPQIEVNDFPLPTMAAEVAALSRRLLHGRGFELLRGFPAAEMTEAENAAVFLGLGAHLGSTRSQNGAGDLLGHVRDVGLDIDDPTVRIYQTNERQTFHTDSTDVVGLMCLETAARGGQSMLVSAAAIFNEMLDRAPPLVARMFEPIATDRRGEIPPGQKPYFEIPIFNWFDDVLTVIYQRQYIDSAQRFEDVAPLDAEMTAAMDLFDEIANDPEMHLGMDLEVGDMQFVHNHGLLHDRTGFVNKPNAPRHLLRLWLSIAGDRELPPSFAQRYGSIEVGNRGGIVARSA